MWEVPEDFSMERIECFACGNAFFVEHMGDMQEFNRPLYCAYCGCEFEYLDIGDEDE